METLEKHTSLSSKKNIWLEKKNFQPLSRKQKQTNCWKANWQSKFGASLVNIKLVKFSGFCL